MWRCNAVPIEETTNKLDKMPKQLKLDLVNYLFIKLSFTLTIFIPVKSKNKIT